MARSDMNKAQVQYAILDFPVIRRSTAHALPTAVCDGRRHPTGAIEPV